jgi:hypothetical protein
LPIDSSFPRSFEKAEVKESQVKKQRHAVLPVLCLLCAGALAAPGADKSNPGQPFQDLSQKLDTNTAAINQVAVDVKQVTATVGQNNLAIQEIPELTAALLGEGATHWVSPFWNEFFADNAAANTSVNILNLGPRAVEVTVTFYSSTGVPLVVNDLNIGPRNVERIPFVGAVAFAGWVEVTASDNVLVEGALTTSTSRQGGIVGMRERSMAWYRVAESEPQN